MKAETMFVVKNQNVILGRVVEYSDGWLFLSNTADHKNGRVYRASAYGAVPKWARGGTEFLTKTQWEARTARFLGTKRKEAQTMKNTCKHVLSPMDPRCIHCGKGITETQNKIYRHNALGGGEWMPKIRRLGAALSVVAKAEVSEISMHEDVSAHYAPSECHDDVSRGEERRMEEATAKAEQIAGAPWGEIVQQAKERGLDVNYYHHWERLIGRMYARHGFYAHMG